jgi:hypothetical protein
MVAAMTNPSTAVTQAGAFRKNAGTASTAEMTRVTTIAVSAPRLPRRAGTRDSSVMSPSAATPRLTISGGASGDPMTAVSATSMSPSRAKMAVAASPRDAGVASVSWVAVMAFSQFSPGTCHRRYGPGGRGRTG